MPTSWTMVAVRQLVEKSPPRPAVIILIFPIIYVAGRIRVVQRKHIKKGPVVGQAHEDVRVRVKQ